MTAKYTAYVRMDKDTVAVLPMDVSKEEAEEQLTRFMQHMMRFPGGTQSVGGWIEPTA